MTEQLDIESFLARTDRNGSTYEREFDFDRLNRQERIVYEAFSRGGYYSPRELEDMTGFNWASISARFRDFKNIHGLKTDKRRRGDPKNGVFEYWVEART